MDPADAVTQIAPTVVETYGVFGAVLVLLAYDLFYLQRKLLTTIDKNTEALVRLQEHCERTMLQHPNGGR